MQTLLEMYTNEVSMTEKRKQESIRVKPALWHGVKKAALAEADSAGSFVSIADIVESAQLIYMAESHPSIKVIK